MPWIKRNLYFVITIVVGLGLAGYCGYLLFAALNNTAKASEDYAAAQSQYNQLKDKKPFPSKENIQAAEADAVRVQKFLEDFRKPFSAFPTPAKLDDSHFATFLQKSIYDLGKEATNAGVGITPGYAFGFSQLTDKLNYPSDCITPWMQEMEEMTAILHILYNAKINFLERIKRPAIQSSATLDTGGEDYTQFSPVTNQYGVVTPYTVLFRAFSSEIANVLAGVAASSNCLIVKAIYVSKSLVPLPELAQLEEPAAPPPSVYYRRPPPQTLPDQFSQPYFGRNPSDRRSQRMLPPVQPQYVMPTPNAPTAPAPPETILREKPLFVTLYIDVIKLKPPEAPASAPKSRTAER